MNNSKKEKTRERETENGKSVVISHCSYITVKWRVHRNAHRSQQHKANVQAYLIHFSPSHPQQFPLSQFDVVIIVVFVVVDDVACVFCDCFSLSGHRIFFFFPTSFILRPFVRSHFYSLPNEPTEYYIQFPSFGVLFTRGGKSVALFWYINTSSEGL